MKTFNDFNSLLIPAIVLCLTLMYACKADKKNDKKEEPIELEKERVIEIVTENMDFQMPDSISSGWTSFRYKNMSPQTHFFLIDKYPEGKTSKDAEEKVGPVFDKAMALIMEGKTEEGYAEFANLPEWFGEVVFIGGSGLVSPGQIAETALEMAPGKYILECYVKMSNGKFHTSMGMTKDLVVTQENSGNSAPNADIDIRISSEKGIVFKDSIGSGEHTFSVFYEDQIAHENFVGHDVNLVRLNEDADLKNLEIWMNWAEPKGLIEPAPSDVLFMGGVNDMPSGSKGYFIANLTPGKYALISEVPDSSSKNMFQIFMVTE